MNFYPRPPRGGRRDGIVPGDITVKFLSTPSARRATYIERIQKAIIEFLSTPSARRATKICLYGEWRIPISIHALREEGDRRHQRGIQADFGISIHALREEGDLPGEGKKQDPDKFLSTPSARRATNGEQSLWPPARFLSTPSARRATDAPLFLQYGVGISIHALREEGDGLLNITAQPSLNFYPRPPRGGRQPGCRPRCRSSKISIHALREEGDVRNSPQLPSAHISIHALREEGD